MLIMEQMVCVCVIERELEITAAIFKTQNQYGDLKHQYTMYIQKTKGEGFVFWYFGDVPVHENLRVGCAYITCAHVCGCVCTVYCVLCTSSSGCFSSFFLSTNRNRTPRPRPRSPHITRTRTRTRSDEITIHSSLQIYLRVRVEWWTLYESW